LRNLMGSMSAVPFDTLKLARKLASGGFTKDQADSAAEALADAMAGAELATKSDIELAKRDLTIRLGGMLVVAVGVILTATRFMIP